MAHAHSVGLVSLLDLAHKSPLLSPSSPSLPPSIYLIQCLLQLAWVMCSMSPRVAKMGAVFSTVQPEQQLHCAHWPPWPDSTPTLGHMLYGAWSNQCESPKTGTACSMGLRLIGTGTMCSLVWPRRPTCVLQLLLQPHCAACCTCSAASGSILHTGSRLAGAATGSGMRGGGGGKVGQSHGQDLCGLTPCYSPSPVNPMGLDEFDTPSITNVGGRKVLPFQRGF